tara:strand:+ start:3905 stop:4360 length:456 start_codon:yes stop_codon:yes gene_type:complete
MKILTILYILLELNNTLEGETIDELNIYIRSIPSTSNQNPYFLICLGLFISTFCAIVFTYLIKSKIELWNSKKVSPLPLGSSTTISSWIGGFSGLILIFSNALIILDFSLRNSILFSLLISFLFGYIMWRVIRNLLTQIEAGTIKEIDDYF